MNLDLAMPNPPKKNLFIKTWGCQMNVYDSNRMQDILSPLGYQPVDSANDADMVILNTCHIREKATEKVFSDLGRLRELQKKRKENTGNNMVIAVAGCVAQAEGKEIMARAPYVDMIFGPQTYQQLPEMVAKIEKSVGRTRIINTDFPVEPKFDSLPATTTQNSPSAFLSIQEGCDKFCTFCVVPYTRGAEYSRPADKIIAEAKTLIASGAREITLLGQNVNAWHGDGLDGTIWSLGRLIRQMAELDNLYSIRYMTSHPGDMSDDLFLAHRDVPQLMPMLHLPVQSGSDKILAAMNRKHTSDDYRRIVDRLRSQRDEFAFSSDFIVGFPGETDKDFADTIRLINDVGFASAYSFNYSPRPGTPAAIEKSHISDTIKSERLAALQELLNAQQLAFNHQTIGRTMPVLFDRKGRQTGQLHGRSPWMQSVHVMAPERLLGHVVDVMITGASNNGIMGDIVTTETPNPEV